LAASSKEKMQKKDQRTRVLGGARLLLGGHVAVGVRLEDREAVVVPVWLFWVCVKGGRKGGRKARTEGSEGVGVSGVGEE
jgi:hypothetical protein